MTPRNFSFLPWRALLAPFALLAAPGAATAADGPEFDAEISARAIYTERDTQAGDGLEPSGFGTRGEVGVMWVDDGTRFRLQGDATYFNYSNEDRDDREGFGIQAELAQEVSDTVTVSGRVRYANDIVALESFSADQLGVEGQVEWSKGNDRIRIGAEWREREYNDRLSTTGRGPSLDVQYNRRIAPWQWFRLELRADSIESDNPRRGYSRQSARATYSHPISRNARLRARIEARQWTYDNRIAQGAPDGELRSDTLVRPMVGITFGRLSGLYGRAYAYYEFRDSNDERYRADAPRFEAAIGYRF